MDALNIPAKFEVPNFGGVPVAPDGPC